MYEWRAETDDVAVALSGAEFFERRGNSLSGKFIAIDELARDVDNKKIGEEWSRQIIMSLVDASFPFSPQLV